MKIEIPELSLVALIGPSGSGKSTLARRHFRPTEVISSDFCRGLVSDDENDLGATSDAFDVLGYVAKKRLGRRKLTVIDATSVRPEDRKHLVTLARDEHALPVALVLNLPLRLCVDRDAAREDRQVGAQVIRRQHAELKRSLHRLQKEGFRRVVILSTPEEVEALELVRTPLWTDRRDERGPFDIIGDVHGCYEELCALLERLGWEVEAAAHRAKPPPGRKAIFLGDLVDRGPASPAVLKLVMALVAAGDALCVPGNHEAKLYKKLRGKDVRVTHGLAETLAQLEAEPPELHQAVTRFIEGLVSHYVLDEGRLVVAHAGLKESLQGRASAAVRDFAMYGETTGETDEYGLPVRYPWAREYRGRAMVVYGHTPVPEPEWINGTVCIDTGCVFGGALTALRYPERELVQVPAQRTYYAPVRPLLPPEAAAPPLAERAHHDLLDIEDVSGKRAITTRLLRTVTVREENAAAALEVMSRFAADPRWLVYLPPTMAPSDTCREGPYLEHPRETFAYFRHEGVPRVICEEKHMGSRAVVVLARSEAAARQRFGVAGDELGIIHTRTGRRFFDDPATEGALLERLRAAMERAELWARLETEWVCLDVELMPWSAKARELLLRQYAPTGAAAKASLSAAVAALRGAAARDEGSRPLLERFTERRASAEAYVEAYRRYCWEVESLDDLKIAPFHLLASEGRAHLDRDHGWHMERLGELCRADEALLRRTATRLVDLTDPESEAEATRWWEGLTEAGGEGMVVKPLDFVVQGPRGLVQPALKCRGREYLRIIYGPEYTRPEHLERLRSRGLRHKRSLALREFALGHEALSRFVQREPLYRVHECVFAVLALESEPVDPRL